MLTQQEVFDGTARHLLTQRKSALNYYGDSATKCVYRNNDGLKCAVGCWIPDGQYTHEMEGVNASDLIGAYRIPGLDKEDHGLLLDDLQGLHDSHNPVDWHDELRWLADNYNLSHAVLNEFEPITDEELT